MADGSIGVLFQGYNDEKIDIKYCKTYKYLLFLCV